MYVCLYVCKCMYVCMYRDSRVAIVTDQMSYYPKSNAGFESMPQIVVGTPAALEVSRCVCMYVCMYVCTVCMYSI